VGTSFFRFVKIHAFDRRIDGRTDGQIFHSWLYCSHGYTVRCITCSRTVTTSYAK